ncbi:putative transferase, protein kinase RLK-Pelle-RLCK-VIIa-2 family [Helianthus annuus]|nr:putative transferase, protein kinase RLK-Pelle-RLCK-VIIa-2 family [Helianthus annuus]
MFQPFEIISSPYLSLIKFYILCFFLDSKLYPFLFTLLDELRIHLPKMFTYDELKLATRNFSHETFLGEGRYGKVYKGWVNKRTYSPCMDATDTELPIAVKKLHRYTLVSHFHLKMLKEFLHPNLVKFIGFCSQCEQLFLVYEFMPKGNFKDLLHSGKQHIEFQTKN